MPTITLAAEAVDSELGIGSSLSSKTGTYHYLCDSWSEQHTNRGSAASIRMMWAEQDDWRMRKALLGYSYVDRTGTPKLHRVLPLRRPNRKAVYLRELRRVLTGRHQSSWSTDVGGNAKDQPAPDGGIPQPSIGAESGTDWPVGFDVVYDAQFGPLPEGMNIADNSTAWASNELCRYVSGTRTPKPRELTLTAGGHGVVFDDGISTPAAVGTPFITQEIEFVYTWYQIPVDGIPGEAAFNVSSGNVGRINSDYFDGVYFLYGDSTATEIRFPPATMMFRGARETLPYPGADGRFYVDLNYVFSFRSCPGPLASGASSSNYMLISGSTYELGWDALRKPDGSFMMIKIAGVTPTRRLYQRAAHMNLFKVA